MSADCRLIDFVKNANYSDDNISQIKKELKRTNKQLIRDSFELLRSAIKLYDNSEADSLIIYNAIIFMMVLCSREIFTSSEIEINKERIKRARETLYPYANDNELNTKSVDLLDEIILDKTLSTVRLNILIKELIDKEENIDIIKKFINLNRAVVSESTDLFNYVFDKAIEALKDDNRDVYYYITLLKLTYSTKVNKNNYLSRLYPFERDIITDEIACILEGSKRPYDKDKILDKYGIVTDPSISLVQPKGKLLYNEPIITIDAKGTFLKDDALSIKKDGNNYIIRIYVTNPTQIVRMGSHADKDACNNFKSMYLPKGRIHMLNKKVEANVSLEKNKTREVFVLEAVVTKYGELLDYHLMKDAIVVSYNITYDYAEQILSGQRKDSDLDFLKTLNHLANALRHNNNKKIEYWKLKDSANNVRERIESERLISEYMILYNRLVATIAKEEKIPYIYRGKEEEYISKLVTKLGIDIDNRMQKILSGLYIDSIYSKDPIFHYGLGFDCYSHSTDPGRRYVDLYNQYLMNDYYFNKQDKDNFDYDRLDLLIEYFNKRDRELSLMQAEYIRSLHLNK